MLLEFADGSEWRLLPPAARSIVGQIDSEFAAEEAA
jgi:hypothetical protein